MRRSWQTSTWKAGGAGFSWATRIHADGAVCSKACDRSTGSATVAWPERQRSTASAEVEARRGAGQEGSVADASAGLTAGSATLAQREAGPVAAAALVEAGVGADAG